MLTLLVMRHAKSSWDQPELDDFDRPLQRRGERAAPLVAAAIARHNLIPGFVLCSPARRTRETLGLVLQTLKAPKVETRFDAKFYAASAGDWLATVQALATPATIVLIVGHNPAVETLARTLAEPSSRPEYGALIEKFPTGALAVIEFKGRDWSMVKPQTGKLAHFIKPRDLA